MKCNISEKPFGIYENKPVTAYTLTNHNGMEVTIINYGAAITRIITPDRYGNKGNVIQGFGTLQEYIDKAECYNGVIVGRYCNRIANAVFTLDGREYKLAPNHNGNSLHGGIRGFDKAWWNIECLDDDCSLKLTSFSKDGEEGFPGNLYAEVIYRLTEDNSLVLDYYAVTDKPSPVNLTSHCYFNLSAGMEPSVLEHELLLFAQEYTVLNNNAIPTGEIAPVEGTAYDFTHPKKIGKDIANVNGYDINFVLNKQAGIAAIVYEGRSGRRMEMFSSEPGVQLYTGKIQQEGLTVNSETRYTALCLEAQHFPNSPNEPRFPNTVLRPGETYRQTTSYRFSAL